MTQYSNEIVFQWVSTTISKDWLGFTKNKVIVVTWVSGSGKSSFAFDTVYKEDNFVI